MDMVVQVYRLTEGFPRHETFGLTAQMQRAAVSVPSNVAEGYTREHLREYLHHISIAQGSLAELETQLEIAGRLGYLESSALRDSLEAVSALGRQLYALRNALAKRLRESDAEDSYSAVVDPPGSPDTRHLAPDTHV